MPKDDIYFVYDGECPICQMGAKLFRIRQAVGELHTIDGRNEKTHPVVKQVNTARFNLDKGMVIKYQDKLYQGDKALHLMAKLGDDKSWFNKTNRLLFSSQPVATALYPFMKGARNIVLMVKNVPKIRNLDE